MFVRCLIPLIDRQIPVFPIPGNHDYDGYYDDLIPDAYIDYFLLDDQKTYAYWQAGPACFLALDPNRNFPLALDAEQMAWAKATMRSPIWTGAAWRIILIHQPPFAQGWPGYSGDGFIRNFVENNAESGRIDIVMSGHCHDFEYLQRDYGTQRTHFLVLGGAGGGLEPPENDTTWSMDTIIKDHHYALFEMDSTQVQMKIINAKGRPLWSGILKH
jgi:hypothetical protein